MNSDDFSALRERLKSVNVTDERDLVAWMDAMATVRFRLEALGSSDAGETWRDVLTILLRCGSDTTRTDFKVIEALHSAAKLDRAIACWIVKTAGTVVHLTPPFRAAERRTAPSDITWEPVKNAIAEKVVALRWIDTRDAPLFAVSAVAVLKQFKSDEEAFTTRMQEAIPKYNPKFTPWAMHMAAGPALGFPIMDGRKRRTNADATPLQENILRQLHGEASDSHRSKSTRILIAYVVVPLTNIFMRASPVLFVLVLLDSALRSAWHLLQGDFTLV